MKTVVREVRSSLRLLSPRDRRALVGLTCVQMALALLDLIGVILIGVVAGLAVASASGQPMPAIAANALSVLGLSDLDLVQTTAVLGTTAAGVLLLKSFASAMLTRRTLRFLGTRQADVACRLAEGLLSLPLLQALRRSTQESAYILTSGVAFATLVILGQAVVAVSECALLIVLIVGLLWIDPVLTLFTVAFFSAIAAAVHFSLSNWAQRLGSFVASSEIESQRRVQEALKAYRELTVSQRRGFYVQALGDLRHQSARAQSDIQFIGLVPKYIFEFSLVIGAGLLVLSQWLMKDAEAAIAVVAVFLAAATRMLPSLLRLQGAAISVRIAAAQAAPAFELAEELGRSPFISAVTSESISTVASRLTADHESFTPTIVLDDVSVTYPEGKDFALRSITLRVDAGQSLAIVGSTGAGKSTLTDIMLGVLRPDHGTVRIGGHTPSEAVLEWPGAISYVPQEVVIINGTVRENVALGIPDELIDDDRVYEALEGAFLSDFLRDSRQGIETYVGEGGARLSGGQRQRVGLARALYTRPRLLILDEATSALDAETEQVISRTIEKLEGRVTTVTVAHRLSTIRHCDIIVYLERGAAVAVGDFARVRELSPAFDRQARLMGLT